MKTPHPSGARTPPLAALQALSADEPLLQTLRQGRFEGRVHSVFERVVNVEDGNGELVTLAGSDVDNAPNTLIVDSPLFGMTGVAVGDRVTASEGTLAIGERVEIGIGGAVPWAGRTPAYPADASRLRANVAVVRGGIGRLGTPCDVSSRDASTEFAAEMSRILGQRALVLCAALSRGDLDAAGIHGKAMLGVGPGLTPSGDDFLVGLFAVLHIERSPCHPFRSVCADIVADVERRTNAISAAALRAAAHGRVRESIHALIGELMAGRDESLLASLSTVLAIGSTSGTDIVEGIVSGFEVNLHVGGLLSCQ